MTESLREEIKKLHSEIVGLIQTTLDKTSRLGKLCLSVETEDKQKEGIKKYLTTPEAVEYTTLSRSVIMRLVAAGKIPYHRLGRRLIFDVAEIDKWIYEGGTRK